MEQENQLNIALVTENTLIFGRNVSIGSFSLDSKQLKFHYIPNNSLKSRGIKCLACERTASIVAVDDISEPRILLYTFPEFKCISQLESRC